MLKIALIALATLFLPGCALFPKNGGVEEGAVWCNVRYLDTVKQYGGSFAATDRNTNMYKIAERGYVYALAGAVVLQETDPSHALNPRLVLEPILGLDRGRQESGFRAVTFRSVDPARPELVIAFKGTNDTRDWLMQNLYPGSSAEQFQQARDYVLLVQEHLEPGWRIVATGFSLGGGLAAHVAQHPDTADLIEEAWVFNPSPRDGVWTEANDKIWFASARGEILNWFRWDYVGAPVEQRTKAFDLIHSSNIYGHSRWVLARQMLHYADLKEHVDSHRTSTTSVPLQILQESDASACSKEAMDLIATERKRYQRERSQPRPSGEASP